MYFEAKEADRSLAFDRSALTMALPITSQNSDALQHEVRVAVCMLEADDQLYLHVQEHQLDYQYHQLLSSLRHLSVRSRSLHVTCDARYRPPYLALVCANALVQSVGGSV